MSDSKTDGPGALPVLRPLNVPWMLSPSGPGLKATCVEEPWACQVTAYALFGPLAETYLKDEDAEDPGYHLIRVEFIRSGWSRFSPIFAERDPIQRAQYDWSQVPFRGPVDMTTDGRGEYTRAWMANGACPDSGAYEVLESAWAREPRVARFGLRHFILVGHDAYVEVLAMDWKWSLASRE
ncbi:hypothetical protein [Melittangium boletus]|uniref:hypothetical protein n=1 Tax=Melittangium boletus TaxID=83453 RepID=UPI003DA5447F